MASIEYIQKRIEGKEKELEKLTKKLERIRKAEAGNWEKDNPYCYSESDLRWCLKDIEAAQMALSEYRDRLLEENEKAGSRNVKAIIDFIEMWKERVRSHYQEMFTAYLTAIEEYRRKSKEHADWYNRGGIREHGGIEIDRAYSAYVKAFREEWAFLSSYIENTLNKETWKREYTLDTDKLNKDLEEEGKRKYDFIIERTNRIVGQITDASGLHIGSTQELNGYIVGTKGTAKVQTIGAGGYNIQCFHFRTLINRA